MKILFTGASSFSGYWMVRSLSVAGHDLHCPLRGIPSSYEGLRAERMKRLDGLCTVYPDTTFGSDRFLKLLEAERFDFLCHHASEVGNYKSPDFDVYAAFRNNTFQIPRVISALKQSGARALVLTGTTFEANEARGSLPLRAFSPYGLSKTITFEYARFCCDSIGLPLGKFVLPNPFGPLEEPRFTHYLMSQWRKGALVQVRTPDYVRDNIHVDLLAREYARFLGSIENQTGVVQRCNPCGYVEKQGDFARRVAREVQSRLGWKCDLELQQQTDFSEPLERFNFEPAVVANPGWREAAAWDAFVEFYQSVLPEKR
jgi:nucleoside-diphosphate-sugar epimerase